MQSLSMRYATAGRTGAVNCTEEEEEELANAAWAFATADQSDVSLLATLATAAEQHMGDFT